MDQHGVATFPPWSNYDEPVQGPRTEAQTRMHELTQYMNAQLILMLEEEDDDPAGPA